MDYGSEIARKQKKGVSTSMLSVHEQDQLKKLLQIIETEETERKNIQSDVSRRLRDEKGRFLPNELRLQTKEELPSKSDRLVKIEKLKGSYNSYLIKDRWFTDGEIDALIVLGIIGVLAVIF
jgi:hypothetical protein